MAYTLIEAVSDLEKRLGVYEPAKNNWRYGTLTKIRYDHQPFSGTALRRFFDRVVEGEGSRRTVNMFFDFPHFKNLYEAQAGPIVRMIVDFTDHTSMYISADSGVDQSQIWNNQYTNSFDELWQAGRLFRFPTMEVQEQIRFKLMETAPDIYLYTGEK